MQAKPACLAAAQDAWQPVLLLIIDEVSMLSPQLLSLCNERLQELKACSGLFGDVITVCTGDLSQLEPVRASCLATPPDLDAGGKKAQKEASLAEATLWHTTVFCLEENHRQRGASRYLDILRRFKAGRPSSADIEHLNKRVLTVLRDEVPPSTALMLTPDNFTREAVNAAAFEAWCDEQFRRYPDSTTPWQTRNALKCDAALQFNLFNLLLA